MIHQWQQIAETPCPRYRCAACDKYLDLHGLTPEQSGVWRSECRPGEQATPVQPPTKESVARQMLDSIRALEQCEATGEDLMALISHCQTCDEYRADCVGCSRGSCSDRWGRWRRALAGRTCEKMPAR
jgi:hypothetical protein